MDRFEGAAMLLSKGSVLVVSSFSTFNKPLSPPQAIHPDGDDDDNDDNGDNDDNDNDDDDNDDNDDEGTLVSVP